MPIVPSLVWVLLAAPVEMPRVVDPRLQLELVLQEPDVRTPTGLAVDRRGHVLVIESHTHFRPDGYQGPPHDRILRIDPTRKPARPTVFFEGSKYTMNLACAPDGSIYVATRSEIFRLRDADDDGRADERTAMAHLETAGNYPHNGLSGFAFRGDEIYFGFGENLGADYRLVGSDGSSLSGGGEGGNVYACRLDGSKLRRIATGFWNPFHLTFDGRGNLFAVDNDPDSRPPCRLLHVVDDGDYGFKFRHGRKGTHPFTAWNGELPGTLPMVCGTGEAPCAIVWGATAQLPDVAADDLLVTSWGDHRIERYRLVRRGASFTSAMQPVVVGGENFRPTGMAAAPDGSIYFADWVDKSYPLHGKGRVWRLSVRQRSNVAALATTPAAATANVDGAAAGSRAESSPELRRSWAEARSRGTLDPFEWQELANRLTRSLRGAATLDEAGAAKLLADFGSPKSPESTIWAAVAARNADEPGAALTPRLLAHDDPRVRLLGVMWAGDGAMIELGGAVEAGLNRPGLTRELFEASSAALERLAAARRADDDPPKKQSSGEDYAVRMLKDSASPPSLRRFALKALRPDHPELTSALLQQLIGSDDAAMRREAIRTLRERPPSERRQPLTKSATDRTRPADERIEALLGLAPDDADERAVLERLTDDDAAEVAEAARRKLRRASSAQATSNAAAPSAREIDARIASLGDAGDPAAGERLFFHPRAGACFRCHEHAGRGALVGPSLTTFGRYASRERVLESILDPGREMAPQFVPWSITTVDGVTKTGVYVGEEVTGEHRYADEQGRVFLVHPREMEGREAARRSIMPADFGRTLSDADLRDLAAFLNAGSPAP